MHTHSRMLFSLKSGLQILLTATNHQLGSFLDLIFFNQLTEIFSKGHSSNLKVILKSNTFKQTKKLKVIFI